MTMPPFPSLNEPTPIRTGIPDVSRRTIFVAGACTALVIGVLVSQVEVMTAKRQPIPIKTTCATTVLKNAATVPFKLEPQQ